MKQQRIRFITSKNYREEGKHQLDVLRVLYKDFGKLLSQIWWDVD